MARLALPIDPLLPQIAAALRAPGTNLILRASPGCGKTTRVPPAILASVTGDEEVLVLEPRRLAAKYSATRVAEEMGIRLGALVGYQFRLENVSSRETRLRFLTEGMLLRRLMGDPRLEKVACVILDEFHERHLHSDLALAYLRRLQTTERPDLRIVVMSATLDTDALAAFLPGAQVITSEAPVFPVNISHLPEPMSRQLDVEVAQAVRSVLREEIAGNVLVFLPGMAEIRRAQTAIGTHVGVEILALHGELPKEEQARAFAPGGPRRVILSTNIAETSLTLPGITAVIDSGLHRQASHSWWSGVPALRTRPISKASAIQRAGRAGRTAPGRCLRLYTLGDFQGRAAFDTPEIRRADLAQSALELKALGVRELGAFSWFERPEESALAACEKLLYRLGAVQGDGTLVDFGRRIARIPAHPRIARLLLEAEKQGCLDDAATLAALLQEGAIETLDATASLQGSDAGGWGVRRTRELLLSALREAPSPRPAKPRPLEYAVLTGYPDRVALKRAIPSSSRRGKEHEVDLVFSAGGSAQVAETGVIHEGDCFVTLEIQELKHAGQTRSQLKVRSVVKIERDWLLDLEPSGVREEVAVTWDSARGRVIASERLLYDELVLDESPASAAGAAAETSRLLLKHGLGLDLAGAGPLTPHDCVAALGKTLTPEVAEKILARALFVAKHLGTNAPSTASLKETLVSTVAGKTSLQELKELDWAGALLQAVLGEQSYRANALAPDSVTLPSGRKVEVHYKLDQTPWIESRMQDFFGLKAGPAAAEGRIPIVLHLLAPNYRPVQVTTDLKGFWERGYQEVKNALSRRYPRHYWPDDPLVAEPPAFRPRRS